MLNSFQIKIIVVFMNIKYYCLNNAQFFISLSNKLKTSTALANHWSVFVFSTNVYCKEIVTHIYASIIEDFVPVIVYFLFKDLTDAPGFAQEI